MTAKSSTADLKSIVDDPFPNPPEQRSDVSADQYRAAVLDHTAKVCASADFLAHLLSANDAGVKSAVPFLPSLLLKATSFLLQTVGGLLRDSHTHFSPTGDAHGPVSQHVMLTRVAQCQFLMSRKLFLTNMQGPDAVSSVKKVYEAMLELIQQYLSILRDMAPQSATTIATNGLLYLVVMSLCNMLCPWATLLDYPEVDTLPQTDVGLTVHAWLKSTRPQVSAQLSAQPGGIEGYLSIITLALGMHYIHGRQGEVEKTRSHAMDLVLEAFQAKVWKWLVHLMPKPSQLIALPKAVFCSTCHQMATFVLRNTIPVVRHVAKLDVDSCREFLSSAVPAGSTTGFSQQLAATTSAPFTSSVRHFLDFLAETIPELPVELLEPSQTIASEVDESFYESTDITLFVWRHMASHFHEVFGTQKQRKWEVYTLKLVTSYLRVATALCRNEAYAKHVFMRFDSLFSTYYECPQLLWTSLLAQCREGIWLVPTLGDARPDARGQAAVPAHSIFASRQHSKQVSAAYFAKHFVRFNEAVFSLLGETCFCCPSVAAEAAKALSIDETFRHISDPPSVPQPVFGASLYYLASLVRSSESQILQAIWRKMEMVPMDVLTIFQEECKKGRYDITRGFMLLMYRTLENAQTTRADDRVDQASVVRYLQFVVGDVLCGFTRRLYVLPDEKYEVGALAASVLLRGFSQDVWANFASPLAAVMPGPKGTDVLSELLGVMSDCIAEQTPLRLLAAKNLCLWKFLQLAGAMHKLSIKFPDPTCAVISRAFSGEDLLCELVRCLPIGDVNVRSEAVSLAKTLSGIPMRSVARLLLGSQKKGEKIKRYFFHQLDPRHEPAAEIDVVCPRSIKVLKTECTLDGIVANLEVRIRLGLIELLIANATVPVPSLTSFLCGYGYHPNVLHPSCLTCILNSLNDHHFCEERPQLAAKYVKLVYLLIRNPSTWTDGLRELLRCRDEQKYMESVYRFTQRSGMEDIDRYGYILKTLSLNVFDGIDTDFVLRHLRNMFLSETELGAALRETPPFKSWLALALGRAPEFPALSTPPPRSPALLVVNGVPQYDIISLYDSFVEEPHGHEPRLEALKKSLKPFIVANEALSAHAAIVNFVEGWCELVSVVCGRVSDVPAELMLELLHRCLMGISSTAKISFEFQHRALHTLSGTAVSLLSALRQLCDAAPELPRSFPEELLRNVINGLFDALLLHGAHAISVRHNVYSCFVILLSMRGVALNPEVVDRIRVPLTACLVSDCTALQNVPLQVTALRALQKFVSNAKIAALFIAGRSGLYDATMTYFVERTFSSVDDVVCVALGVCAAEDSSRAAYLIDAFFAALRDLSHTQSTFLVQASALSLLTSMKSWAACTRIYIGRPSEGGESLSKIPAVRDIARRLLHAALSWVNVLCHHSLRNPTATTAVADFVRNSKPMLTELFSSPFLASASTSNIYITTQLLEVLYQGSLLMLELSCVPTLRSTVPQLVEVFSLVPLLNLILHRDTRLGRHFVGSEGPVARTPLGGLATGNASRHQSQLLAESSRALLLFFLICSQCKGACEDPFGGRGSEIFSSVLQSVAAAHDESSDEGGAKGIFASCLEIVALILQTEILRNRSGVVSKGTEELVMKVVERFVLLTNAPPTADPPSHFQGSGSLAHQGTRASAHMRNILLQLRRLLTDKKGSMDAGPEPSGFTAPPALAIMPRRLS